MDICITNATLVNEGETRECDIAIKSGRIDKIADSISPPDTAQVIDAKGKHVIPGMIDDQVHFREPGLTHKGEIATESAAATVGGVTSYMEMPNVNPTTTNMPAIQDKLDRAADRSRANYAFYLGATNDNIEDIRSADASKICGIKVFMGSSTGNMLVDDPAIIEAIFRDAPTLIATHCEDTPTILANEKAHVEKYGEDIPAHLHPVIRSEEACYKSSSLAVDLAKKHGCNLHVLHLTTAKELDLFTPGDIAGKKITAEVCAHHLFFCEEDYEAKGHFIKCNPAIKRREDRDALRQALVGDRLDIIATDHAPHTREEKDAPYTRASAGLPLVQHVLLSLFEHYHDGWLPLEMLVKKTSHNVADRYQVKERGYVREGYWADLSIVNLKGSTNADQSPLYYKCGWTPFSGTTFRSSIDATIVSGVLAQENGQLCAFQPGQALEFNRD